MDFDYTLQPGRFPLERNLIRNAEPLVTIVTPFYNAGKYFEQTFYCVMNQTFPWFEWVVVDDGSTDEDSISILEDLCSHDERIVLLRKENGGISSARNMGIRNARTDIIVPLDADDLIEPTFIEINYWALHFNPDYDWAYSNSVGFHNQEYLWDKRFDAMTLKKYNFLTYCGAIRKNAIEQVGCYDEVTKHYYEDWRLWLKLLSHHKKPVKTNNYGFWYRRLDSGVLSLVNNDPDVQDLARRLIDDAASTADISVCAKEYPTVSRHESYQPPKVSSWSQSVFADHKKIHVLMLIPWMEMGGADRYNLDVCSRIDREQFEIGIICSQPGQNAWRQRFAECVSDIFCLPDFLDERDWPEFLSYYIKSREVDVLFISNSYWGYNMLPWIRKEFPQLVILDYVHMEEWLWRRGGYARLSGVMGDIVERTLVCNGKTNEVMSKDFGRDPASIETMYIGVDHRYYAAQVVESGTARKRLGIADNRPLVLFPCRMHPQKRPFLMLEIAKQLRKSIPNVAFAVVGDGPQLDQLRRRVTEEELQDTVYFAGAVQDVRPFYNDAQVTLICSLNEGLSLTAYESLSMGTPVITSDVGGQKELVDASVGRVVPMLQSDASVSKGIEFDSREPELYVRAVHEVIADDAVYTTMCEACPRRAELFSVDRMIDRLQNIFTELRNDPCRLQERERVSAVLRQMPSIIDEYAAVYQLLEKKQFECQEIWQRSESYRQELANEASKAKRYAEKIKRMHNGRSWKLIQGFRGITGHTKFGRASRKLLRSIWDLSHGKQVDK